MNIKISEKQVKLDTLVRFEFWIRSISILRIARNSCDQKNALFCKDNFLFPDYFVLKVLIQWINIEYLSIRRINLHTIWKGYKWIRWKKQDGKCCSLLRWSRPLLRWNRKSGPKIVKHPRHCKKWFIELPQSMLANRSRKT